MVCDPKRLTLLPIYPQIKRCVKELVQWKQNGATTELVDTIKYCSLHYNDSTTPEKIRTLMNK